MPVKSNEAKLTPTQHFIHTCMRCQVFIHGGIVQVRQLTQPMLDKIAEIVSGGKTLSTIRRDVVSKFLIYSIAPHVIQTAVNRVNAQRETRQCGFLMHRNWPECRSLMRILGGNIRLPSQHSSSIH